MKQLSYILIVVLFAFFTITVLQGQINYGLIPQSYQVDWANAGLLLGTSLNAVDYFNVVNYGADTRKLVVRLEGMRRVLFSAHFKGVRFKHERGNQH